MKFGVLGTGDVGRAIAGGLRALGHEVMIGARSATNERALAMARELGAGVSTGTFRDAARFGEAVVLATLGVANAEVLTSVGVDNLAGKVLFDTTNPLDFSQGLPPSLLVPTEGSGGQQVQALAPEAKVVKVFNTVGAALMFRQDVTSERPSMFLCGNDEGAKRTAGELVAAFGWEPVDVGSLAAAHWLEAMCMVWINVAVRSERWDRVFKLVAR